MKVKNLAVSSIAVLISMGAAQAASAQSQSFQYRCDQGRVFQAAFSPNDAVVNLQDGRSLQMRQVLSASGTRYKNAGYLLSTKGNEAFITLEGQMLYQNCLTRSINRTSGTILKFQTKTSKVRVYRQGEQTLLEVASRKDGSAWLRGVPLRSDMSSMGTVYTTLQGENVVKVFESQDGKIQSLQIGDHPPEMAETQIVSGSVSYRQRIALPPNATVRVQLQDVSKADAPAVTIAEQTIETNGKQVPIPFSLVYNPADIESTGRYTVRAQILIDKQLRWTSTTADPVITQGTPTKDVEIMVNQVGDR
ncbi:MAG TPA: YbaY family lipoprotein [Leptolyngbya sp.]|jgi:uncharacterized lipoprotein YbaY/membrane-bound inhibitor of C-type lysozyme|nr:YbaY family lipoprotein [Leptolyngbya sp.]